MPAPRDANAMHAHGNTWDQIGAIEVAFGVPAANN
jgi:hypothetical protein